MTEWNLEDMGWRYMRIAPCPFCGRVPVIITADMNNQIGCDEPGCGFSIVMDGDPKRIIQYWNRLAARDPDDRSSGERIEPCPGCGSRDIIRGCESTRKGEMFYIGCRQCGYTEEESDPGLAIAKWNREGERMTDDGQPDLKPCPFCGAGREDLLILDRQDYGMYWKTGIYCYGCGSTILYDSDTDDEDRMLKDAVAKWNRRRGSQRRSTTGCA